MVSAPPSNHKIMWSKNLKIEFSDGLPHIRFTMFDNIM